MLGDGHRYPAVDGFTAFYPFLPFDDQLLSLHFLNTFSAKRRIEDDDPGILFFTPLLTCFASFHRLFVLPVPTVCREVTAVSALLVYRSPIPVSLRWYRLRSDRDPSNFSQPCRSVAALTAPSFNAWLWASFRYLLPHMTRWRFIYVSYSVDECIGFLPPVKSTGDRTRTRWANW